MKQLKALLCDHDGVLVNTAPLYYEANRQLLAELGQQLTSADYYKHFLMTNKGLAGVLAASCHSENLAQLRRRRDEYYEELLLSAADLVFPGVAETLSNLAAKYRLAIVSTCPPRHFEIIHRDRSLLSHFELIITGEQYEKSKPHPDPYLLALKRLELPASACLAVEDSPRGIAAAQAAGLEVWQVLSDFHQPQTQATRVLNAFADLQDLL